MQKLTRSFLLAGAAFGLAACGDDVSVTPPTPPSPAVVTAVTVSPASITIAKGQTVVATAQVQVSTGSGTVDKTVAWTSADANIATVGGSTGAITGVNPGTTTVRATAGGVTGAATVTVTLGVQSVSVTPSSIALNVGQKATPAATVTTDAGCTAAACKTVTWTSSAPAVASVNATTGEITALTVGTTSIVAASSVDASKTAALSVVVSAVPNNLQSLTVAPTAATLGVGGKVTIVPNAITVGAVVPTYTFTSSAPAVATVDSTGKVTGVASGTAIITTTATTSTNSLSATTTVTVITPQISINSLTTGATNVPVAINNVHGQIEVNLNFQPSGLAIDSVVVFMNQPGGPQRVARQNFGGAVPAAGVLSLSVNTANFVKNAAAPSVTVDLLNGPSTVSAKIFPKDTIGTSATNCTNNSSDPTCASPVAIVLNNVDGWTADITKPSVSATSASNITYWGGPTANATAIVYPVIYTPGRSISDAEWTIGSGAGSCSTVQTGVLAASNGGHTQAGQKKTFGYVSNGADVACTSYENTTAERDNVIVGNAIDNTNNTFASSPLIANTIVFNATPDSLRLDYLAPTVNTPSITRTLPAVTGWVNGAFSFINYSSSDNGVGLRATRDRKTTYSSVNCSGVTATDAAMATGTGADINGAVACPTNFIGGTPGLAGTAPWTVKGWESDRLGNLGKSGSTQTFGTDYTAPGIRWGLIDAGLALPVAYGGTATDPVDSTYFAAKPVAGTNEFRAEYLDDRAGFYNAGDYDAVNDIAAQFHALTSAGHVKPTGNVVVGTGTPGATFVTDPQSTPVRITAAVAGVRVDGWKAGQRVDIPQPESYYGYKTYVVDAAGNQSATLFRSALVNMRSPFSTGLGVPATLTATTFVFNATHADSAEVVGQSLALNYPAVPAPTALRYSRETVGTAFDDVISSPLALTISPTHGAPYARGIEATSAAAFPATNVQAYTPATVKPTTATVWSWNVGSTFGFGVGFPAPSVSPVIPIPALNVQDGTGVAAWNIANPTIAVNHFRLIPTLANTNQFGSTTPLRSQVVSPTNAPNPPFTRVDFYRLDAGGTWWNYLGSSSTALGTDQGTYRSWIYDLPTASFKNAWNTKVAQAAPASGESFIAVGVLSNGDAIVTQLQVMP